ncbi:hypothetical protein LCI18_014987 [Fusarium solani-melongenae]|uniref:Uncharacterized protein n=1 Tax=Fusarium solani subsp. cucurbitae TaxID=2747967 RepID=A0ACD3ZSX6_FUSSC|nr:hypothetical protein LCI18_014987 [Fusarium solani-melongenae]
MWLINTASIELERAEAMGVQTAPYAILSHTWDQEEVTFDDMMNPGLAKEKKGYSKIENVCRLARQRGLAYAWVDTCCVDKRSSAELAEAINSMFRWYRRSAVCFTYLSDLEPHYGKEEDTLPGFSACRWFTRGWTLQELIASENLEFYDSRWHCRGTKEKMRHEISGITGIEVAVLKNNERLESIPVAKRMSWAAHRRTTRIEDLAYCLLGIFDVNMPMMYGEGSKAFTRLQEEIVKETNDLSMFSWKVQEGISDEDNENLALCQEFRGILAHSPAEFAHCRNLRRVPNFKPSLVFTLTNKGLLLETFLGKTDNKEYVLNLDCITTDGIDQEQRVGVFLTKTADGFVRTRPTELFETQDSRVWAGARQKVFIRKRVTPFGSWNLKNLSSTNLAFRFNISPQFYLHSFQAKPTSMWDTHRQLFLTDNSERFTGFLDYQITNTANTFVTARILVVCGLMPSGSGGPLQPWVSIYDSLDEARSQKVTNHVGSYYNSWGEEFFLHQLRDDVLNDGSLGHDISLPSESPTCRLHISLAAPEGFRDGVYTVSINITSEENRDGRDGKDSLRDRFLKKLSY